MCQMLYKMEHDVAAAAANDVVTDDTEDIAFAAEAAFAAVEAADAVSQQELYVNNSLQLLRCRICGWGDEEGRPILRFLPVIHDIAAANAAPAVTSFTEDIALHIFCGKTASILPSVNQPDLEILTKAGLKNKHGIGPEVNAALARTRCAIVQQQGSKEKHYYLVREFEAHLAAIRHMHVNFLSETGDPCFSAHHSNHHHHPLHLHQHQINHPYLSMSSLPLLSPTPTSITQQDTSLQMFQIDPNAHTIPDPNHFARADVDSSIDSSEHPMAEEREQQRPLPRSSKLIPSKAAAGKIHKPCRRDPAMVQQQQHSSTNGTNGASSSVPPVLTDDGKVLCGCGGTHWPTDTARGASSWRSHVGTKRHQKWMEANGLLGEVCGLALGEV
jgi:hypothetical protein